MVNMKKVTLVTFTKYTQPYKNDENMVVYSETLQQALVSHWKLNAWDVT